MGGASRWQTRENDELRHLGPPTAGNDDPPRPLGEPVDRCPRRGFPPETYAGRHVGRKESGKRAEREREEETASSPRACVAMSTSATRAEVAASSSRSRARTEAGKFRAIVRK